MTDRKQTSGARLLLLLDELGLNQSDLAEHLKVNRSTVSRWTTMNKFSRTVLTTLDPFLKEYHVSADWIQAGEGSMYSQVQAKEPPGQYVAQVYPPLEGCDQFQMVKGDSMATDFNPGDILCLEKADPGHIISGYYYWLETPYVSILRKILVKNNRLELVALNPVYEPLSIEAEDIVKIFLVKAVVKSII